jgi:hypothetical protein
LFLSGVYGGFGELISIRDALARLVPHAACGHFPIGLSPNHQEEIPASGQSHVAYFLWVCSLPSIGFSFSGHRHLKRVGDFGNVFTGAFFASILEPIFYNRKMLWYEILLDSYHYRVFVRHHERRGQIPRRYGVCLVFCFHGCGFHHLQRQAHQPARRYGH